MNHHIDIIDSIPKIVGCFGFVMMILAMGEYSQDGNEKKVILYGVGAAMMLVVLIL